MYSIFVIWKFKGSQSQRGICFRIDFFNSRKINVSIFHIFFPQSSTQNVALLPIIKTEEELFKKSREALGNTAILEVLLLLFRNVGNKIRYFKYYLEIYPMMRIAAF